MAFLLNKSPIASHFRSHSQKTDDALSLSRRGFHIEPGAREKALLAEDPVLKRFKSHKKSVWRLKRVGDVLTIVVVADAKGHQVGVHEIILMSGMIELNELGLS